MAQARYLPPDREMRRLLASGLTYQQIADEITLSSGRTVSRNTVAAWNHRHGDGKYRRRETYTDVLPWIIKERHNRDYNVFMLRIHARVTRRLPVPAAALKKYQSWKSRLDAEGLVVAYDPDSELGFYHVPRRVSDGDGIIRRPKGVKAPRAHARAS